MAKKISAKSLPIHLVILQEELNRRIRLNSQYSLRSFAKQLDIDASLLSKILQNTRPLSPVNAVKVLERIQLAPNEKILFWESYVKSREETYGQFDPEANRLVGTNKEEENKIDHDLFQTITEPHHYAIVELTRLKNFKYDFAWIGKTVGVSPLEAEEAIERLLSIGLLRKDGKKLVRAPGRVTTKDKSVTTAALKFHQRKILEQAILALDKTPLEERNQSSMTIAINPSKIPLAKKMIQDFVNQLSDVLEVGALEEVYQMSFSLFPLTQTAVKNIFQETPHEKHH